LSSEAQTPTIKKHLGLPFDNLGKFEFRMIKEKLIKKKSRRSFGKILKQV